MSGGAGVQATPKYQADRRQVERRMRALRAGLTGGAGSPAP